MPGEGRSCHVWFCAVERSKAAARVISVSALLLCPVLVLPVSQGPLDLKPCLLILAIQVLRAPKTAAHGWSTYEAGRHAVRCRTSHRA
jgi:hypothetical protein